MSPTLDARRRLARQTSLALAAVAVFTSTVSFFFWGPFHRDVPAGVGNLRGTALAVLLFGVPALVGSMSLSGRGSHRAQIVWAAALGYLAYNAVMFCFAAHFNAYFLLYTTQLALAFWAIVTLVRSLDLGVIALVSGRLPARPIAVYLLACAAFFASAWLVEIVPAVVSDEMPATITRAGVTQNTVWVLDFAFTFPLTVVGAVKLWRHRPWGVVIGGAMTVMLTLETAGIALDQVFGHLQDPTAPLRAVPMMVAFTAVGATASWFFLRGIDRPQRWVRT